MPRKKRARGRYQKPIVVVLTEDTAGVKDYVAGMLRQRQSDKVVFKVFGLGQGPSGLLKESKRVIRGVARDKPKSKRILILVDYIPDQSFQHLLDLTGFQGATIETFPSRLCFEIFFILHFGFMNTPFNCQQSLLRHLRGMPHFESYDKSSGSVPIAAIQPYHSDAKDNARRLRRSSETDGSDNPYTDVDLFFSRIEELRENGT